MAEVGTDDEGIRRVSQVRSQEGSKGVFRRGGSGSNHDRDERGVLRGVRVLELEETMDVGEMKFDAVLVFVDRPCHSSEADGCSVRHGGFGCQELGDELGVQQERIIGERGIVGG